MRAEDSKDISTLPTFGELLAATLGRQERSHQWLASTLNYNPSQISRIKGGIVKPDRMLAIRIARNLGCTASDGDAFIAAAAADANTYYAPLDNDERRDWDVRHGPWSLQHWGERVEQGEYSRTIGEVRSGLRVATTVLRQIDSTRALGDWARLWERESDLDQARELWVRAWRVYYGSASQLYTPHDFAQTISAYEATANRIAAEVRDPAIAGLALYVQSDIAHTIGDAVVSFDRARAALQELSKSHREWNVPSLARRNVILDVAKQPGVRIERIRAEVELAQRAAAVSRENDAHSRSLLLEGTARTMALIGDGRWYSLLETAETEAQAIDQQAHMAIQYSRVSGAASVVNNADRDLIAELGRKAYDRAHTLGWTRRIGQLDSIAAQIGMPFN